MYVWTFIVDYGSQVVINAKVVKWLIAHIKLTIFINGTSLHLSKTSCKTTLVIWTHSMATIMTWLEWWNGWKHMIQYVWMDIDTINKLQWILVLTLSMSFKVFRLYIYKWSWSCICIHSNNGVVINCVTP